RWRARWWRRRDCFEAVVVSVREKNGAKRPLWPHPSARGVLDNERRWDASAIAANFVVQFRGLGPCRSAYRPCRDSAARWSAQTNATGRPQDPARRQIA